MNIHEYQGKEVLKTVRRQPYLTEKWHLPLMKQSKPPKNSERVVVVKAQIHAGGRGKAGGVKIAKSLDEVRTYAERNSR